MNDSSAGSRLLLWATLGVAVVIVGVVALRSLGGRAPAAGPAADAASRPAPDFTLIDRSGRTVTKGDLQGKVWVANFIFTRCSSVCPALSREMAAIRKKLDEQGAGDVVSVSFT